MKKKIKIGDLTIDIVVITILSVMALVCLYPVWYVLAASFTGSTELVKHQGIFFWPKEFTTGAYRIVLQNQMLLGALKNSLIILLVSLPINIVLTLLCGYFMSCTGMMWKKPVVALIMFTMFFGGGLIPGYLNVRDLGLFNTLWSLILPGAISVYNSIICKTAIEAIPDSLKESAYIDGANDFHIIFKIIVPLIKATLAVLLLYYGVSHWNAWFSASIYIRDNAKLPVQNILRGILLANQQLDGAGGDNYNSYAETIKYAAIVITTVPIMCVYPFLQKHFTKGVMIGAVKG